MLEGTIPVEEANEWSLDHLTKVCALLPASAYVDGPPRLTAPNHLGESYPKWEFEDLEVTVCAPSAGENDLAMTIVRRDDGRIGDEELERALLAFFGDGRMWRHDRLMKFGIEFVSAYRHRALVH